MSKIVMVGLAGLVVGSLVGYGMGRVSIGSPVNPLTGGKGSYEDGYNAAKKKLDDAHVFPPAPTETLSLSGTVKSVGTDSLVMEAVLSSPNPLDELNAPKERTVTVSADTKILRQVQMTPEEQQKEFEAFQKAMQNLTPGSPPLNPPQPFKQIEMKFSDVKSGDTVMVSSDKNILLETSFTATTIVVIAQ